MGIVSRGFHGRGRRDDSGRVPPGQYVTEDFPVLSAGPTPHTSLDEWSFSILGGAEPVRWSWEAFRALPTETPTVDIHCVTKWSKLDTQWEGVSVDTLLESVDHDAAYGVAFCDGGYTTNLPLEDLTGGKAWIAFAHDGETLEPEHGGPARLLVPHLYFWKSAKRVRGLTLQDEDEPGFWESNGYQAERSYSLASGPGEPPALAVERLGDGEVSPYLVDEVVPGDRFELRGPIG